MCEITEELRKQVWEKGQIVEGYDSTKVRKDSCGAWIVFDKYNDRNSIFGWEIDHIYPLKKLRDRNIPEKIINSIENLSPLNWLNNKSKGTDYPVYHGSVRAKDNKNERGDYQFEISKELIETLNNLFGKYL